MSNLKTERVAAQHTELLVRASVCNTSYGLLQGKTPWYVDVAGGGLVIIVEAKLSPTMFKNLLTHLGHGDDFLRLWGDR